jgi:hypothetical protein
MLFFYFAHAIANGSIFNDFGACTAAGSMFTA